MVQLDAAGIAYTAHEFAHDPTERSYGLAAARAIGADPDRVFKTLLADVTTSTGTMVVVGIVPVSAQLSLKELAAAIGAKRAEMCVPANAERITGYVVGGISPFGQKKRLRTVIDETCELSDTIFVSGGRRGLDIELAPADLIAALDAVVAPIAVW
ncbi:MAG: transcriptional regulator [Ilumatobacteraceae bacterium]|nr:transcriptional regulator [Ilumatobacteraceae bacterium]